ncbi:MAG: arylsulfatase [Planctomycetaceae bacterium]|nr:arylsulfatase [Planctomycetaceae bacterium]
MTFRISRLATFVLLSVLSVVVTTRAEDRRPNILLILADDLGYGDVSCYNSQSKVATPHVDQLARSGMQFLDAHSPSTVCTPTRYSILTGRMAFRLNYRGVFTGAGGPCLITEDRLTLPQMLHNAGYATAMFGKWHVGMTFFDSEGNAINQNGLEAVQRIDYSRPIPDGPVHRGFDQFFGTACCPTTDWLYAFLENDRIAIPPTQQLDRSNLPKHPYAYDNRRGMIAPDFNLETVDLKFLQKSQQWLRDHVRTHPQQPFFLFHSMQAVHLPSFAAPEFQGVSSAGPHGDFIAEMDFIVGELRKTLSELGVAENTIIVFSSDNGPEVTSVVHMRQDFQHDGARPWRGMKRDDWEGGHRVPLIVSWPGRIHPAVSDEPTCLTDLMATFAAVAQATLPDDSAEDSFNMLPVWLGEARGIRPFLLHQTISLAMSIRRGQWKLLDHRGSGGNRYEGNAELEQYALPELVPDADLQLYDLSADPGETRNLCREHPEVASQLKILLEQTKKSGRSRP